jgi:hypothetical protein
MKNLLLGFLLGLVVATAGAGLAQTSGSIFDYGEGNIKTFRNSDGTTGSIFPYTDSYSTYRDSTGRTGSFYSYGGGVTSYSFSGTPCGK